MRCANISAADNSFQLVSLVFCRCVLVSGSCFFLSGASDVDSDTLAEEQHAASRTLAPLAPHSRSRSLASNQNRVRHRHFSRKVDKICSEIVSVSPPWREHTDVRMCAACVNVLRLNERVHHAKKEKRDGKTYQTCSKEELGDAHLPTNRSVRMLSG